MHPHEHHQNWKHNMKQEIESIAEDIRSKTNAKLVVILIARGNEKFSISTGDALSSAILTLDAAVEVARVIKDGLSPF